MNTRQRAKQQQDRKHQEERGAEGNAGSQPEARRSAALPLASTGIVFQFPCCEVRVSKTGECVLRTHLPHRQILCTGVSRTVSGSELVQEWSLHDPALDVSGAREEHARDHAGRTAMRTALGRSVLECDCEDGRLSLRLGPQVQEHLARSDATLRVCTDYAPHKARAIAEPEGWANPDAWENNWVRAVLVASLVLGAVACAWPLGQRVAPWFGW